MFATRCRVITLVVVSVLVAGRSALGIAPTQATLEYLHANPAELRRGMLNGDRIIALYGTVLASDGTPGAFATTDAFVQDFLINNANALGVDGVVLGDGDVAWQASNTIKIRNDKFEIFTYLQMYHCANPDPGDPEWIPYHNTVLRVPVLLGDSGATPIIPDRIGYVGMHLIQPPGGSLCSDVKTYQNAEDALNDPDEYGPYGLTYSGAAGADLVLYEAGDGTLHRAWRFEGENDDDDIHHFRFLVDSTTAEIVGVEDLVYYSGVTVEAEASRCCHPGRPDWPSCCPSGTADCCCEETDVDYPECAFKCCGWGISTVLGYQHVVHEVATRCLRGYNGML